MRGAGFVHVLVCVPPPQVAEQADQGDQPPFMLQVGGLLAPFVHGSVHTPFTMVFGSVQVLQVGGLLAPFEQTAFETTIFVHAPQLLFSFDSVIMPFGCGGRSAQTRAEYEPFDGNVYDVLKGPVLLAARVGILTAGVLIIAPPPLGFAATCMKLLNRAFVLPVPMLFIVALSGVSTPAVAVVGETGPAVRSGGGRTEK